MTVDFVEVGRVQALNRFPVKSMRGESPTEVHLYWHGLDGDRRYAFVRGDNQSGFPWLTGRQIPDMVRYTPRFTNPDDVIQSSIEVETPNGRFHPIDSPELRAELAAAYGNNVSLIKIGRGVFDSQVVSLMSVETAVALSDAVERPLSTDRFRQNIVIETYSGEPFVEESWLDGVLLFGDRGDGARIRLNRRISRCVMINIDPDTGEKDAHVLKMVTTQRDNCVGVHASPENPGTIHVGDVVRFCKTCR